MKFLRRQYFIYPEIQKPLMMQIFVGLTILSIIQMAGIYLAMKWMGAQVAADISIVVDYRVLGPWKNFLYLSIILPMIINLLIGTFIVLYTSNKFAGPLFRLEREIDRYLNGEADHIQVKFRTSDYLHTLATKINAIDQKTKRQQNLT
ncbi:MAG: hypothetical protein V4654_03595 [Bdellovibrionota bacterium]